MTFPQPDWFQPATLLMMRLMVAAIFLTSGWSHVSRSEERAKSIGMSRGFTLFLGTAEVAGALGIAFGVLAQLAALGLILVMLGAIQKKIAIWHTGFWGENSSGWHYELMLVVMNLVIIATNGGRFILLK